MNYEKHIIRCDKCGKESLVEIIQHGVSHINSISISCKDCGDKEANGNINQNNCTPKSRQLSTIK